MINIFCTICPTWYKVNLIVSTIKTYLKPETRALSPLYEENYDYDNVGVSNGGIR